MTPSTHITPISGSKRGAIIVDRSSVAATTSRRTDAGSSGANNGPGTPKRVWVATSVAPNFQYGEPSAPISRHREAPTSEAKAASISGQGAVVPSTGVTVLLARASTDAR